MTPKKVEIIKKFNNTSRPPATHWLQRYDTDTVTRGRKNERGCSLGNQDLQNPSEGPSAWQSQTETAGKWQKCNLVSGMASVASDMGRLWTGRIGPAPVQMSGMLSGRRAVVIVCGLLQCLVIFSLTSRFFVNTFFGLDSCVLAYCSSVHRCFPSNLSTTTQGAIVKLRGASSELCTLFIWSV